MNPRQRAELERADDRPLAGPPPPERFRRRHQGRPPAARRPRDEAPRRSEPEVGRLREARAAAAAEGWTGFVASQAEWSLAKRNPGTAAPDLVGMDRDMIALHEETGWAAVPYSAQAKGYFDKAGGALDPATARAYDNPRNRDTAARLGSLAARHGATPTQVALAAFRHLPFPVVPVIGPRSPEQVQASWAALSLDLGAEEGNCLARLAQGLAPRGPSGPRAPHPHA